MGFHSKGGGSPGGLWVEKEQETPHKGEIAKSRFRISQSPRPHPVMDSFAGPIFQMRPDN